MDRVAPDTLGSTRRCWLFLRLGGAVACAFAVLLLMACAGRAQSAVECVPGEAWEYRASEFLFLARAEAIDVDGHELAVRHRGSGTPLVLFDAGANTPGRVSWLPVLRSLTDLHLVVYDRAGLGHSSSGPEPRDARRIIGELRTLLGRIGAEPPYVLVGHSLGGLHMQLFARMHPAEIAGIVLVDTTFAAQRELLQRLLTDDEWEALEAAEASVSQFAVEGADAFELSFAQVAEAPPLPDVPLRVLTATEPALTFLPPERAAALQRDWWIAGHRDLAASVPRGHQVLVENSGHNIPADAPEAIVSAIREVLTEVCTAA